MSCEKSEVDFISLSHQNKSPKMGLWIETKSNNGNCYFYHFYSRETTWTRPVGPNVQIMTQSEVDAIALQLKKEQTKLANGKTDHKAPNGHAGSVSVYNDRVSVKVSGSDWCIVWTGDGRVFFYDSKSKKSVWKRPVELLRRADVDLAISNTHEQVMATQSKDNKNVKRRFLATGKCGKFDKIVNRILVQSSNEKTIETKVRAARQRALIPLETRVKSFMKMLEENNYVTYGSWEKENPKLLFDPRYSLLTPIERKEVFDKYVREYAKRDKVSASVSSASDKASVRSRCDYSIQNRGRNDVSRSYRLFNNK